MYNSIHLYNCFQISFTIRYTILLRFIETITFKRFVEQITNWSKTTQKVEHSGATNGPRLFLHAVVPMLKRWYARVSSMSSSRGWRPRVDRKSREPPLASPISRKPSNSFNEDGRTAEACRRKNRRHTHTHIHPYAPLLLFLPVPLPLWNPPRCGRGMLAVPSRCSIFRAFRYFPINRKARARAFARSLARSLARSRANRNKKKHVYTYMCRTRECPRAGAHACTPKYTGTRKHTYVIVYLYYRARVF